MYLNHLTEQGYEVDLAHDGKIGLKKLYENSYDFVYVDTTLPRKSCFEIIDNLCFFLFGQHLLQIPFTYKKSFTLIFPFFVFLSKLSTDS